MDPQTPQEWMRLGEEELRAAQALSNSEICSLRIIRHHCHGAAEMFLKAFLSRYGAPKYTHDLKDLLNECCSRDTSFAQLAATVEALAQDQYLSASGQESCETSTQSHYNPLVDYDSCAPSDWLGAARQIRDFVAAKVQP